MIQYVTGDATNPLTSGPKIIAHICNDIGKWGAGFVLALSRRWDEPERSYKEWYSLQKGNSFYLGAVQFVKVRPDITVANMVAQAGVGTGSKGPPIRYEAVEACLKKLAAMAAYDKASVHMPRIGCALAGGSWAKVEPIIQATLVASSVPVTIYDLAGSRFNP